MRMSQQNDKRHDKQHDDAFDRARMTEGEAEIHANDALVDALLDAHLSPSERDAHGSAMEARISRAFAALDAERAESAASPAPLPFASHGPSTRAARPALRTNRRTIIRLARAALIALAFGAMFLLFPYETNASTLLDRALTDRKSVV
jgi:hypothetical protein